MGMSFHQWNTATKLTALKILTEFFRALQIVENIEHSRTN
jgi:hypothetical protein